MDSHTLLDTTNAFLSRLHLLKREDIPLLRDVIREHNTLYHRDEAPIISDYEYDRFFHTLARLESDTGETDPDSPTSRLRILLDSQFQKVSHLYPMISLDNTYNIEEIRDFENRMRNKLRTEGKTAPEVFSYYLQPKFDGLGLSIIYEYGKLVRVITRGNGAEWEDVTANALEVESILRAIPQLQNLTRFEVRGEIVMPYEAFESVNRSRMEAWERLFANPRNAASGSLRQLDPLVTRGRGLLFLAYSLPQIEQGGEMEIVGTHIVTYHESIDFMRSLGFMVWDMRNPVIQGIDQLIASLEWESNTHTRTKFPYETDGLVIKCDDLSLWSVLWTTEHHPRYAVAYKFPPSQVRTTVLSIEHSVGRTGIVTPVANLHPVHVGGVIVKRATLHNYDELEKKDVRIGDSVYLVRAGEVIPEIVTVISEVRTGHEVRVLPPEHCPVCGSELFRNEGKVAYFCPNLQCPAQIQGRFETFVGKHALDIDWLGEKQIALFLKKWWLTDFASVFHLMVYETEIRTLEGYKEKSLSNLRESLERARNTTLDRVFVGLGIPNVGSKTAKVLARHILEELESMNVDTLIERCTHLSQEELTTLPDIWPETAESITLFFRANADMVRAVFTELSFEIPQRIRSWNEQVLTGKSFCVTGSFSTMSREVIHSLIEAYGGEVRTSVTAKLDYLIVWEAAGSKKLKAESLGVTILSLEEFLQITHDGYMTP